MNSVTERKIMQVRIENLVVDDGLIKSIAYYGEVREVVIDAASARVHVFLSTDPKNVAELIVLI
jgi:hypothetical protein